MLRLLWAGPLGGMLVEFYLRAASRSLVQGREYPALGTFPGHYINGVPMYENGKKMGVVLRFSWFLWKNGKRSV